MFLDSKVADPIETIFSVQLYTTDYDIVKNPNLLQEKNSIPCFGDSNICLSESWCWHLNKQLPRQPQASDDRVHENPCCEPHETPAHLIILRVQ